MKVCVVGTGYVGLVSGAGLASVGHAVVCVDRREEVVAAIRAGRSPIHEDGLEALLAAGVAEGRLSASTDLAESVAGADVILVAVGTPSADGRIDLSQIRAASAEIGRAIRGRTDSPSIVVKSTVLPGTTDTVVRGELESASGLTHAAGGFGLGMNPEFLREGRAVPDFVRPDRIVFGADDPRTLGRLRELYAPWAVDKLETNTRTAEAIKYANNCLLALQISAVNELANAAAAAGGIDFRAVVAGVSADRRWSPTLADGSRVRPGILDYLIPGCGFGGSCFPKDLEAMRTFCADHGVPPRVLQAVLDVNAAQPGRVATALGQRLGGLGGKRVLVLGTAFKPDTDDIRLSAARPVIAGLVAAGAQVFAHDPIALNAATREWADLGFVAVSDWQTAAAESDAVVLVTAWPEYLALPDRLPAGWPGTVFDARGAWPPGRFAPGRYLSFLGDSGR